MTKRKYAVTSKIHMRMAANPGEWVPLNIGDTKALRALIQHYGARIEIKAKPRRASNNKTTILTYSPGQRGNTGSLRFVEARMLTIPSLETWMRAKSPAK